LKSKVTKEVERRIKELDEKEKTEKLTEGNHKEAQYNRKAKSETMDHENNSGKWRENPKKETCTRRSREREVAKERNCNGQEKDLPLIFGWMKRKDVGEGKRGDKMRLVKELLRHPWKHLLKRSAKAIRWIWH